jgi:hypothetical protein
VTGIGRKCFRLGREGVWSETTRERVRHETEVGDDGGHLCSCVAAGPLSRLGGWGRGSLRGSGRTRSDHACEEHDHDDPEEERKKDARHGCQHGAEPDTESDGSYWPLKQRRLDRWGVWRGWGLRRGRRHVGYLDDSSNDHSIAHSDLCCPGGGIGACKDFKVLSRLSIDALDAVLHRQNITDSALAGSHPIQATAFAQTRGSWGPGRRCSVRIR